MVFSEIKNVIRNAQMIMQGKDLAIVNQNDVIRYEDICHSALGSMLMFGWQHGAQTDTPGISVGMSYSAYAGLVVEYYKNLGQAYNSEELYSILTKDGYQWDRNIERIIDQDITQYYDRINKAKDVLIQKLPTVVDSEAKEALCVEACMAMFFLGRSLLSQ